MENVLLSIADALEKLAAGYRELAEIKASNGVSEGTPAEPTKELPPVEVAPKITIEQVRAVLAEKSKNGKRKEVKDLLFKYDSGKLSGVKPEDYAALLADAEAL